MTALGVSTEDFVGLEGAHTFHVSTFREAEKSNNVRDVLAAQSYVGGFIAGFSAMPSQFKLKDTDVPGIKFWLDNYCANHPLTTIFEASKELGLELSKRSESSLGGSKEVRSVGVEVEEWCPGAELTCPERPIREADITPRLL